MQNTLNKEYNLFGFEIKASIQIPIPHGVIRIFVNSRESKKKTETIGNTI